MSHNSLVKPFLKWAGGKRQLAPQIKQRILKYNTYYEPFVGAGAILFAEQPKKAVINDLNQQLCETYRAIKENVDEVIGLLEEHAAKNKILGSEYFYEVREMDRDESFKNLDVEVIAARMIYLNKTCYNGLYRVNSSGLFNTPYGNYKNPAICEPQVLRAVSNYFNNNDVEIMNKDFEDAISNAKRGDFVYFDPPYDRPNTTNFTGYQAGGFDQDEQERLRDVVLKLTESGVNCLVSNLSTNFIQEIYGDTDVFTIEYVEATRMINCDPSGRGKVEEVLIRNWK